MRQTFAFLFVLAACGSVSSTTSDASSTCTTGLTKCGTTCVDTRNDPMNCNACGTVCDGTNATAACVSGVCNAICNAGFGNCDTDPTTACTTSLIDDENNCGFCGNICPAGDTCKQGSCKRKSVLVIGDAGGAYVTCVVAGLTPFFDGVDVVSGVPLAADLASHEAVLVFNNGTTPDPTGLGNALADFSDAKGHVVEALYGIGGLTPMAGRWGTDNYRVLSGTYITTAVAIGTIAEPTSPLMVGVATLSATRSVTGTAVNGGVVVASFNNGQPFVVRGTKNNHNRVDLGVFPGGCSGAYWTGDGFQLMANALNF
jgi:hypothetical protein